MGLFKKEKKKRIIPKTKQGWNQLIESCSRVVVWNQYEQVEESNK